MEPTDPDKPEAPKRPDKTRVAQRKRDLKPFTVKAALKNNLRDPALYPVIQDRG